MLVKKLLAVVSILALMLMLVPLGLAQGDALVMTDERVEVAEGLMLRELGRLPLLAENDYQHPVAFYGKAQHFLQLANTDIDPAAYVIVLIRGWMPNPGYGIKVEGVSVDGHTLRVEYTLHNPVPDMAYPDVMSYAYDVVELSEFEPDFGNYFVVANEQKTSDDPYELPMPLVARLTLQQREMKMAHGNLSQEFTLPIAPVAVGAEVMVPVRAFMDAFGAQVAFIASTRQVRVVHGELEAYLRLGSPEVIINGQRVQNEASVELRQGHTVAPLSLLAKILGAEVNQGASDDEVVVYLHNWRK